MSRCLAVLAITLLCCTLGQSSPLSGTGNQATAAGASTTAKGVSSSGSSSSSSQQAATSLKQGPVAPDKAAAPPAAPAAAAKAAAAASVAAPAASAASGASAAQKPVAQLPAAASSKAAAEKTPSPDGGAKAAPAPPAAAATPQPPPAAATAAAPGAQKVSSQPPAQPAADAGSPAKQQPAAGPASAPKTNTNPTGKPAATQVQAKAAQVPSDRTAAEPIAGVAATVADKTPSTTGQAPQVGQAQKQQPLPQPEAQPASSGMQGNLALQPVAGSLQQLLPTPSAAAAGQEGEAMPGPPQTQLGSNIAGAGPTATAANPVGSTGGMAALPGVPLGTWGAEMPQLQQPTQLQPIQMQAMQPQPTQLPTAQLPMVAQQPQSQPLAALQQPPAAGAVAQQPAMPTQTQGAFGAPLLAQQAPYTTFGSTAASNAPTFSTFGAAAAPQQDLTAAGVGLPLQGSFTGGSSNLRLQAPPAASGFPSGTNAGQVQQPANAQNTAATFGTAAVAAGSADSGGALPVIPTALNNPGLQQPLGSSQQIEQPLMTAAQAVGLQGQLSTSSKESVAPAPTTFAPAAAATTAATATAAMQQDAMLPDTAVQPAADGQPVPTFGTGSADGHAAAERTSVPHSTFGTPPSVASFATPAAAAAGNAASMQHPAPATDGQETPNASQAPSSSSGQQPAGQQKAPSWDSGGDLGAQDWETPQPADKGSDASDTAQGKPLSKSWVKSAGGGGRRGQAFRMRQQGRDAATDSVGLSSDSGAGDFDGFDQEQEQPQQKKRKWKQQGSRAKLQQRKRGTAEGVAQDATTGAGAAAGVRAGSSKGAKAQQDQQPLVVALGDYVMRQGSFGTGLVDPTGEEEASKGWVSRLAAEYKGKAQVLNKGQATATSEAGVAMVDELLKELPDAGTRVKLVIVSFGGNDAVSRAHGSGNSSSSSNTTSPRLPAAATAANLKAIIGKLRGAGVLSILLVTPPPAARRPDRPLQGIKDVASAAADVARAINVPLVDMFAAVAALPNWQATAVKDDGLRLSDQGQDLLFKQVMLVVGSQLQSVSPDSLPKLRSELGGGSSVL